jgi:RNA polymerase sporulation-specific sigma factor
VAVRLDNLCPPDTTDAELVVRWRSGDPRALDALLDRHRGLVRAKARGYFLVGADFDDVEQEGLIGLFKAVRDFRPDYGVAFRAFADVCVTRQIISAIKAASRRKHEPLNRAVSLSPGRGRDDAGVYVFERSLHKSDGDPAERVLSAEQLAAMRSALLRMLSTFECDVLVLYMEGRSYREISSELGRHVKSIDNALQRVKIKLETHLAAVA